MEDGLTCKNGPVFKGKKQDLTVLQRGTFIMFLLYSLIIPKFRTVKATGCKQRYSTNLVYVMHLRICVQYTVQHTSRPTPATKPHLQHTVASARRSGQEDFQRGTPRVSLASCSISPFLRAFIITEAQEVFTIVTPEGLFTPTRVPQGVLNATSYFQGVMTDLLCGLDCKVWVDDVFYFAEDETSLLCLLDEILGRLECWFVRRCSQVHFFRSRIGLV